MSIETHVFDKNLHNGNAYLKSFKEIKHKLFSNFLYYSFELLVQTYKPGLFLDIKHLLHIHISIFVHIIMDRSYAA